MIIFQNLCPSTNIKQGLLLGKNINYPELKHLRFSYFLKSIGPKIWSDIPENLKFLSPYPFGKQYKSVRYLTQIPIDFRFICLVTFLWFCFDAPLFPYVFTSTVARPHPFLRSIPPFMFYSHYFLFCLLILSNVNLMHFVTFFTVFNW